jgi:hypothetical protein
VSKITFESLDYKNLQPLSANESANHMANASDSDICKINIGRHLRNYENFLMNATVYDCASILISENNWFHKRRRSNCNTIIGKSSPPQAKQIILVDFGKMYESEWGLIHYGLVIKVLNQKLLIVPMTTAKKHFVRAYHKQNNPTGNFELRQALKTEGFTTDATLIINDIKCISMGRVLPTNDLVIIEDRIFANIREHINRLTMSDLYKENQNKMQKLEKENERAKKYLSAFYAKCKDLYLSVEAFLESSKKDVDEV